MYVRLVARSEETVDPQRCSEVNAYL
uniref:Uncharacterized protein n=1 Tax=Anguilla anguilla TaxID=7936 RepID=A0A0E9SZ81_ANGAN